MTCQKDTLCHSLCHCYHPFKVSLSSCQTSECRFRSLIYPDIRLWTVSEWVMWWFELFQCFSEWLKHSTVDLFYSTVWWCLLLVYYYYLCNGHSFLWLGKFLWFSDVALWNVRCYSLLVVLQNHIKLIFLSLKIWFEICFEVFLEQLINTS